MRHRARTLVLVALFAPALLVVVLLRLASPAAHATPDGLGALSGVYDMLVHDDPETLGYEHCIVRLDEDSATHEVVTVAQCYADTGVGDPNAQPAVRRPGEGPDGNPGPPPPPPYDGAPPAAGSGHYDPNADTLVLNSCISNLGGQLGPNVVAVLDFFSPVQQLSLNGQLDGQIAVYPRQGIAQCDSLLPQGTPDQARSVTLHPIADVNGPGPSTPAAWRTPGNTDFDGDGCPDASELPFDRVGVPGCGDDPYSPLDSSTSAPPAVGGSYTIVFTLARADACWAGMSSSGPCSLTGGGIIPGSYYTCLADLQPSGANVAARMICYIDDPTVVVNPQLAGDSDHDGVPDTACPPAAFGQCGDGLPGAAPPGATDPGGLKLFADIDDRHMALAGLLNTNNGALTLAGCWEDRDGFASLGNVYLSISFDAYTGHGDASIWPHQTTAACTGGAPQGAPVAASVDAARQATAEQARDTDSDGCPDARELGDAPLAGGLRDPYNSNDYPDMPTGASGAKDHKIRINDVSYVVQRYHHDMGGTTLPLYDAQADHGPALKGSHPWNLTPGNGLIRISDISAVVQQYHQDCV